jgi:N-acetylglucosamine-6-sulfatase
MRRHAPTAALLAASLLTASLAACREAGTAPAPPNVVVIMTDDQTARSLSVMPRTLELLGEAGTTFDRAFASYPLCCPSRATFLTGQYSHNHGVASNRPPEGGYGRLDHRETLPVWLQEAGYATTHIGK